MREDEVFWSQIPAHTSLILHRNDEFSGHGEYCIVLLMYDVFCD